jgi:hypothetical protein
VSGRNTQRAVVEQVVLDLRLLVAYVVGDEDGYPMLRMSDGRGTVVLLSCGDDGPVELAALGAERLGTEGMRLADEIRLEAAARLG